MRKDFLKKLFRIEILLVILILFGVFMRFYKLDGPLEGDEVIYGISTMKFHKQGFTAGRDYVLEHPPLGKWIVGLPSNYINADYKPLKFLDKDMFVWAYIAYDALAKNYVALRTMEAVLGVSSLLLIFIIARQLFGFRAALWSTVIAALSFEMIGYSRVIFMESPMIFFTLLTLFLYINYLKSSNRKRLLYFGLFFISLTVTLLTRHIQPLFLLPIFAVSQFLLNRNVKENLYVLALIGISYYMVFYVIFPQDIFSFGQARFGQSSALGFISFKIFQVIGHLIFRNSFLFLASLIAIGYITIQKGMKIRESIHPVLIIFFALSFAAFSVLSFPLPRHYVFMFLPLYIVGGYALEQVTKNKILYAVFILLAIVNVGMLVQQFPHFLTYFSLGGFQFQSMATMQPEDFQKKMDALDAANASNVMTNDPNVLIFFNGQKSPLTPAIDVYCNDKTVESLDLTNLTIFYIPPKDLDIANNPFVCPLLKVELSKTANVKILEA